MTTPPIGYDDTGAPIEEVVTTATRIRSGAFGVLVGLVGLVVLGRAIGNELGAQRAGRRRQVRAARRARRPRPR